VIVRSAINDSSAKPLSESSPVGISIAILYDFIVLRIFTIEEYGSLSVFLMPLPSKASNITSQFLIIFNDAGDLYFVSLMFLLLAAIFLRIERFVLQSAVISFSELVNTTFTL